MRELRRLSKTFFLKFITLDKLIFRVLRDDIGIGIGIKV